MGVKRKRRRRLAEVELTPAQEWDLLLARSWSPDPKGKGFDTPFARRAAWLAHRERLLADCLGSGNRPGAWWEYDAPGQPLTLADDAYTVEEREIAALVRLGEATAQEIALFLKWFELDFGSADKPPEQLFRLQPHMRLHWEHERKLVEKIRSGEIKPVASLT